MVTGATGEGEGGCHGKDFGKTLDFCEGKGPSGILAAGRVAEINKSLEAVIAARISQSAPLFLKGFMFSLQVDSL